MYGIHGGPSYESLADNVSTFKERIPASLLPFANDGCGNQHCIGVSGEYIGKIYFWEHEGESQVTLIPTGIA